MNARRLFAVLSLTLVMALALSGCYPIAGVRLAGSGNLVTKDLDITGFNAVDAGGAFDVTITQGASYAVSVTADDNVWPYVVAEKQGNTLTLGTKNLMNLGSLHLSAKITTPSLSSVTVSGASKGTLSGLEADAPLTGEASGASKLSGDAQVASATLRASGASTISLTGAAESLTVDASGASTADLSQFKVNSANVSLSGASRANIDVQSKLDYDLSGASHLTFSGNPTMGRMDTSGASGVEHRQ